jgi:hypothetical protein
MLTDRRPVLTTFADKLAVRGYVASRVGADVLPELHAVTDTPTALRWGELPREFAIKPTHAPGAGILVADFAPPDAEVPQPTDDWVQALVRPDRVSWSRLLELCENWVSRGYSRGQWAYRHVPRRVLVEELLDDGGHVPLDYKIFVFDGVVRMIQVTLDRFDGIAKSLYTPDWERLQAEYGAPGGADVERPGVLPDMLEIAETLGGGMDFVRVDLYCLGGRIVFGELTNYPLGGQGTFRPAELDRWLGAWWTLPRPGA